MLGAAEPRTRIGRRRPAAAAGVTVFTGARVLVGDGSVIDNADLRGRPAIVSVPSGRRRRWTVPAAQTTVDPTGLTVMPTIVDTHTHEPRRATLTPICDRRATRRQRGHELGTGHRRDIAVRHETIPETRCIYGGPRLHGARAGPHGHSVLGHHLEEQARAAVREQAALEVDIVKVWVDDRNGMYEKLSPEIYTAG